MQDLSTNMVLLPGVSKMEFLRRIYMEKRKDTWSPQRHSDSPTYQLPTTTQSHTKEYDVDKVTHLVEQIQAMAGDIYNDRIPHPKLVAKKEKK